MGALPLLPPPKGQHCRSQSHFNGGLLCYDRAIIISWFTNWRSKGWWDGGPTRCKTQGGGGKTGERLCWTYRQQTSPGQRGERPSPTPPVSRLLSAALVNGKLAALQRERRRAIEREGECNLLTSSLKEPFTCVDTLEWLEGLSASREKEPSGGGREERKVK